MDGGPLAQFRENSPRHPLDPGVLRGLAGVGYIEIDHGQAMKAVRSRIKLFAFAAAPIKLSSFMHSNGEE